VRRFEAVHGAARAARHFVIEELRGRGDLETVVDDAALVLTELASNALAHAGTGFTVSIASLPAGTVRLSVHDGSPVLPVLRGEDLTASCGRGLQLVAGLATGWGMERTGEGKVVWAELRP
jgi:two-component sensor histidine kinase